MTLEHVAAALAASVRSSGHVIYCLPNLEFVFAHIVTRPFATLSVSRKCPHRSAHWVAHLGGCPTPNDHAMPKHPGRLTPPLFISSHVIMRIALQDDEHS
jgi:hypothetical protein